MVGCRGSERVYTELESNESVPESAPGRRRMERQGRLWGVILS